MESSSGPEAPDPRRQSVWMTPLIAVVVLIVLPCCGVPIFCLTFPTVLEWSNRSTFDSDTWKTTNDNEIRYHMSWDLVHGGILKGETASKVEALLGKPGSIDTFDDTPTMPKFSTPHFKRGVKSWYYSLGGELYNPGLGPSGAILAVDFENGKVFDVRKVIH